MYCISKGKDHIKYEFGSKASIAVTTNSGIIVGAVHFSTNIYDGHTLPDTLTQTTELVAADQRVPFVTEDIVGKGLSMALQ